MDETIQDVVRPGCKNREKLHSIISKISENASSEESAMNDDTEHGFEVIIAEHNDGGNKRKAERKNDTSRKLLKGESSVNESEAFVGGEGLEAENVTIFPDLHHESPFTLDGDTVHSSSSGNHGDTIMDTSPMYPQMPMRGLKSRSNHRRHIQDDDDDSMSDEEMNLMQQIALGLVPTKKRRRLSPCPSQMTQVPFEFQRKLEELEKEVRNLQNRNRALEESYKKLSDLVEAQNHLLSSGGPMLQRMPTPAQFKDDCVRTSEDTDRKVIATASVPSYVTSTPVSCVTQPMKTQVNTPLNSRTSSKMSFELPRRVSAKEVLSLWEHGSDYFPPLKDWTPTQKLKQQSKISRWKKLVDIFRNDYDGNLDRFEDSFSDSKGEILPVTTILSLYETQQTPAFLNTSNQNENGTQSPTRCRSEDDDRSSRTRLHSDLDSEVSEEGGSECVEGKGPEQLQQENSVSSVKCEPTGEVRYSLPRKVTPRDIVHLWENGCEQFPPVGNWSRAQKIGQETKIFRWKKVVDIFNSDCKRSWVTFDIKYTNDKGQPLAISAIIAKYDTEYAVHGPIFDKIEPRRLSSMSATGSTVSLGHELEGETVIVKARNTVEPIEVKIEIPSLESADDVFTLSGSDSAFGSQDSLDRCHTIDTGDDKGLSGRSSSEPCLSPNKEGKYLLPRKVTAKDVIKMWEEGYGGMPPLAQWSPSQKAGQRSKFSRWAKVYDIYKYHCKGSMEEFERLFTDERGELFPITTIVAMYDARDTFGSGAVSFNGASSPQSNMGIPESDIYQLPRKVSAKDVVRLWEEGCEIFPAVCKWPKIHRVGHETKLFRWKKIVDIFRRDCGGSWVKFEARFSSAKGELLPISAILAKFDLENEPISYYKPLSLNGTVSEKSERIDNVQEISKVIKAPEILENESRVVEDRDTPTSPTKQAEFILPKKVSALDVIYLWENGLGDMPPVCQWTTTQRASQRSKISRWNKIVDIFKYECGSDIREFEEKYKDERGELMPITTILNLHDAQDKSWE